MTEPIAEAVERFVRSAGQVAADDPLFTREADLIETGYLDSVGIVTLFTYIETEFHLTLDDDTWADLEPMSIDEITALIAGRVRTPPSPPAYR